MSAALPPPVVAYISCVSKTSPHRQNKRRRLNTTCAPAPDGDADSDGAGEGGLISLAVRIAEDGDVADDAPREGNVSCTSKTSRNCQNEWVRITIASPPTSAEEGTDGDSAVKGGLISLSVHIAEDGGVADDTPPKGDATAHPAQIIFAQTIKADYSAFACLCQRLMPKAMATSTWIAVSLATTT